MTTRPLGHCTQQIAEYRSQAVNDNDGTFRSADELKGITPDKEVIAYCRIGERSSHTWKISTWIPKC